ncbi:hypothetical protein PQR52_31320, partial [Paraburkholderia aspalathi]|uniref:hypothetical protein n=1 Tax=Paraburkholderia aspalathi TaxID=1324617 RepID=UPI0038B7BAB4
KIIPARGPGQKNPGAGGPPRGGRSTRITGVMAAGIQCTRIRLPEYRRLTFAANISLHGPKFWLNAAANQLDPIPESI